MQGIEERDSSIGIHVVRLHYTAGPDKRTEAWEAAARQGVKERDWRREYEIDWTVASGLPVYAEDFSREFHVSKEPLCAFPDRALYRGWDFGLTPSCTWSQLDAMGRLNTLTCHVVWDGRGEMRQMGIERFADEVLALGRDWFPGISEYRDIADPAGWQKAQTDEKSCVDVMRSKGIYPIPGPVTWTARKEAMTRVLGQARGGRALLMVSSDCHMIIEGFEGAYKFEEIGETGRYKETVEKNAWSHPMNSLEYVVGHLFGKPVATGETTQRGTRGRPDGVSGY